MNLGKILWSAAIYCWPSPAIATLLVIVIGGLTPALAGEVVQFDYTQEEIGVSTVYDRTLQVVLTNVNDADYDYVVALTAVQPSPQRVTLPAPRGVTKSNLQSGCKDASKCEKALNTHLALRKALFGEEELEGWRKSAAELEDCVGAREAVEKHFADLADLGRYTVNENDLFVALASTGPGGRLIIRVTAKLKKVTATISDPAKPCTVEVTTVDWPAGDAKPPAAQRHEKERVFTISFGPPRGVSFGVGPFLANVQRREYERANDPGSDGLILALKEDSDWSYGVAAYWYAAVLESEALGVCWGVGYNVQNEPDEAINGLLGLYWKPRRSSPAVVNLGVAAGRETELQSGWAVGSPIGPSEQIPTTTELKVRGFLGISFSFGG